MANPLKDYTSVDFFQEKVVPQILNDFNKEFIKTIKEKWGKQAKKFSEKLSLVLYNAYVEYLLKRVKSQTLSSAFNDTLIVLEKYFPEIVSYVNDFEILKRFIYPPSKPFPVDLSMRFTILETENEIDNIMKRGILLEYFTLPYRFSIHGVWVFTEEDLKNAEFLEEWRKEQILSEARYLTQEIFYSEKGNYFIPAVYVRYRGKYWYVVKYYFKENFYIPNYKPVDEISRRWKQHFKDRWLGSLTIDVYGKKPSTLDLNRPKDYEFLKSLKEDISSVILL